MQEALPSPKWLIKCHAVQRSLNYVVNRLDKRVQVVSHGSLATNLQLVDSDIDLTLRITGVQVRAILWPLDCGIASALRVVCM
jgi:hypothetical protein